MIDPQPDYRPERDSPVVRTCRHCRRPSKLVFETADGGRRCLDCATRWLDARQAAGEPLPGPGGG